MSKIAILHPMIKVKGGAIKTLFEIGRHLDASGDDVTFYTFDLDRANCFPELNKDLKIINLNVKGFGKIIGILRLIFILRHADIILAGNSPMHFVGVFAKLIHPKLKVAWFLQNLPVYHMLQNKSLFTDIKRFAEKYMIDFLDLIMVNSTFIQNEVRRCFNKDSEILYPSIDTSYFSNDHQSLEENQTLFTYSRLTKGKNVQLAIKTYVELQKNHPGLKLIIGGDGEERDKLEEMSRFFPDIQFLGEIDAAQVKDHLQRCTVFLFTSEIDAFGLTILEAMSMEKSIVSLACGGAMELIGNNENGYLAKNEEEFIRYADHLLNDPATRYEMGQVGRKWAVEHFSLQSMYSRIDELL